MNGAGAEPFRHESVLCAAMEPFARIRSRYRAKLWPDASSIEFIMKRDAEARTHFVRIMILLRPRLLPIARHQSHNTDWRDCMRKAVFAGAVALAMMGPLLVSEHGFGPCVGRRLRRSS